MSIRAHSIQPVQSPPDSPFARAVAHVGGPSAMARRLSEVTGERILHSTVIKWRTRRVPADRCRAVVEVAPLVTLHELRPDVFGDSQ